MSEAASREFLRRCVAKICQNVGWSYIQSSPLELLTDLMKDYIMTVARIAYNYALHSGNVEANVHHLEMAFRDLGISVDDLREYVRYVDSSSLQDVPQYPLPRENHLNLLKPGSREVVTRPVHIHEHLPPMHPHLEDQELSIKTSPLNVESTSGTSTPAGSPKSKVFKRPVDPVAEGPAAKRSRYLHEEDVRPLRELSSVVMTTSGFLSHAREGKLPEARTPVKLEACSIERVTDNDIKEKKKKYKLGDNKKDDKDASTGDQQNHEIITKEDDKVKKLTISRESPKTSKMSSPGGHLLKHLPNITTKLVKAPLKKALLNVPGQGVSNPPLIKKLPKLDKIFYPANKDSNPSGSGSEYKLSTEPDKQKLNILKKISKVKDDGEGTEKPETLSKEVSTLIDMTIESVIKREMGEVANTSHSPTCVKEEKPLDLIRSHSPRANLMPTQSINHPSDSNTQMIKSFEKSDGAQPEGIIIGKSASRVLPPHTESILLADMVASHVNHLVNPTIISSPKVEKPKKKEKAKPTKEWDMVKPTKDWDIVKPTKDWDIVRPSKEWDVVDKGDTVHDQFGHSGASSAPKPEGSRLFSGTTISQVIKEVNIAPVDFTASPLPTAPGLIPSTTSLVPPILGGMINHCSDLHISPIKSEPKPQFSADVDKSLTSDKSLVVALIPPEVAASGDAAALSKKKEHKKDKKDKLKKKKKNKLKSKDKEEKKKLKLEKKEKSKDKIKLKKEKKEKKKEKEAEEAAASESIPSVVAGAVPKITLKLGPASPVENPTETLPRKIVIKPIVPKEPVAPKQERGQSPEIARFSPLLQPPKPKILKVLPTPPPEVVEQRPKENVIQEAAKPPPPALGPSGSAGVLVVGEPLDGDGNKIWICPACSRLDDGSPMIGCDGCDNWYHWECVGITFAPMDSEDWFCSICRNRKKASGMSEKKKKKNKKNLGKKIIISSST